MSVNLSCRPTIRRASAGDIGLMQAMENDAAMRFGLVEGMGFCVDLPARSAREHEAAQSRGVALIADHDGAPAGFALVSVLDGRAHLFELGVVMAAQGRGIGRALIAAAEAWAAAAGHGEMTLTTYRDISWNAPFYARLGFDPFVADPERPEFLALLGDEIAHGVHAAPRLSMRKILAARFGAPRDTLIRAERSAEFALIGDLIGGAFAGLEHAEGDEPEFVARLRGEPGYRPDLALVALPDGEGGRGPIGHIMLCEQTIATAAGPAPILFLACVAVARAFQRSGIGRALIEAALDRAGKAGAQGVILVGDPAYYSRLGFVEAAKFGIVEGDGAQSPYVLARELRPRALAEAAGRIDLPH